MVKKNKNIEINQEQITQRSFPNSNKVYIDGEIKKY